MDRKQNGQGLVEFALTLPVILMLVLGILNFGYFFTVHTSLVHAAREAVRYGMVHPEDAVGICNRVGDQVSLTTPDLRKVTLSYNDTITQTCESPTSVDDGFLPGQDQVSVRIEHNLPALTPLIRASFQMDILAQRTITRVGEG